MSHHIEHHLYPVIALAALGAGCGPAPATFHDALQQLTQAYCEADFRCCTAAQAMAKSGVADAAHCSMAVSPALVQFGAQAQAAIDKGLYTYDGTAATLCIDGVRGALSSCTASAYGTDVQSNPICASVLAGTLQPGASCNVANFGGGCAQGSYCALGTCKLAAKSGEDCATNACGVGLVCLTTARCGAPLDDGQPCTIGTQCKSGTCTNTACAITPTVAQHICM